MTVDRAYQGANTILSATATTAAAMYMVRLVANRLRDDDVGTWPGVLGGGVFMASSMGAAQARPCRTSTGQGISARQDQAVGIGPWPGGLKDEWRCNRSRVPQYGRTPQIRCEPVPRNPRRLRA